MKLQERLREQYRSTGQNYLQEAADRLDVLETEIARLCALAPIEQEPVAWESPEDAFTRHALWQSAILSSGRHPSTPRRASRANV